MKHFLGVAVHELPEACTGSRRLQVRAINRNLLVHFGDGDKNPDIEVGRMILVEAKSGKDAFYKHAFYSHATWNAEANNVTIKKYDMWHWSNPGNCGVTPKHAFFLTLRQCDFREDVIRSEWNKFAKAWGFNPRHGGIR